MIGTKLFTKHSKAWQVKYVGILSLKHLIHFAKSKALKIQNRNRLRTNINTPSDKINLPSAYITLPNSSSTNIIGNDLNKFGIITVSIFCKMIHNLQPLSTRRNILSDAVFLAKTVNLDILAKRRETFRNVYMNTEERLELAILIMNFSNIILSLITTLILVQPLC